MAHEDTRNTVFSANVAQAPQVIAAVRAQERDERLTSWEAAQTMAEVKSSSRRKRAPIDDVAAAVLLRDYLEHKKQLARPPRPSVERSQS